MNTNRGADTFPLNCIMDVKTGEPVCPLRNVEINAVLDTFVSEVTLTQNYLNTSGQTIEALYTFPVPHDAQVTGFTCRISGDRIQGEFREKEEAFREYDRAVRKGDSAFLFESHRPDIFQVSLGNIAAGETVSITISYLEDVKIIDRELRWSIPTVVAPRYIPGNKTGPKTRLKTGLKTGPGTADPTDLVPDADYITPAVGKTDYTLKIKAVLKGIKGLKKVSSPSHPVEVGINGEDVTVTLSKENEPLDSDFIITAQLADRSRNGFITAAGSNGMFGSASFCPDLSDHLKKPGACEYIFLIDVSGSMGGEKLEQAKRALSISLRNLLEGDWFNIIAFESSYSYLSNESLPYSKSTLESADKWISALTEMGGTEIYEPLRFVLERSKGIKGLERVVFLFTDGQVGNENQIVSLVRSNGVSLQLYPFGIDTAVNRFFIDGLAKAGNGVPEYIYPGERIEDKVIRQFSRIHQPYLTHLSVTGKAGRELETVPPLPARLFDSEAFSFMIRTDKGEMQDVLRICGDVGDKRLEFELKGEDTGDERLLGLKWAKGRITELESQMNSTYERRNDLVRKEIIDLSIKYSVLSTLTSLVAVYTRKTKAVGAPQTVVVPVAAPRGWTMPIAQDKAFAFAPLCVTESCMRSYQDENDGISGMKYDRDVSGSTEIPTFPGKRRSVPGRSGFGGTIRMRTEKSTYPSTTQALDHKAGAGATEAGTTCINAGLHEMTDIKASLHEMIITAAQLQDAAGSFGTGEDAILRTSCFIIGMLLLDEEWKPYRIQLIKAGEALLKALAGNDHIVADAQTAAISATQTGSWTQTDSWTRTDSPAQSANPEGSASLPLAAAALAMLTGAGLLRYDTKTSSLEEVVKSLPGNASGLFNAILSGDPEQLPDADRSILVAVGSIPEPGADKKSRAADYLQAVINNAIIDSF